MLSRGAFFFLLGIGKWAVLMMEFDITYVPQKAIKGQALADFLAAHPLPDDSPLITNLPDEEVMLTESIGPHWEMYFDGASRAINGDPPRRKAGDRVVFVTPAKGVVYHSFSILKPDCSNKEAEYEALIFGLITALDMGIFYLYAHGDSQLVIRQIQGIYEVRKPELVPYHALVLKLMERFAFIEVHHVPRRRNAEADALAKLAAALTLPSEGEADVRVEQRLLLPPMLDIVSDQLQATQAECSPVEHPDWRLPFIEYFKHGRLPDGPAKRIELRRRLPQYLLHNDILYRKSYEQTWLRCLSGQEARKAMEEVHSGVCGAHQSGPKMYHRLKVMGYFWPKMTKDCIEYADSHLCSSSIMPSSFCGR